MTVRLYVLVRELGGGRFFAASVDYPDDSAEGDSPDAAVASVVEQLEGTIRRMPPTLRVGLGRSAEPEIVPIPVTITLPPGESTTTITVPLVVSRRETSGGGVLIGRVPGVPHFEVVVRDRGDLEAAASHILAAGLQEWPIASTLALDVDLPVEFRHVQVELPDLDDEDDDDDNDEDDDEDGETFLSEFGDDLTARARAGRLPSLDRRDELVERLLGVLTSEERPSALLVGQRDVGKTTLVYELARRIVSGDVPKPLQDRRVWRIPANELIAGARYTGMWQGRARSLVTEARETRAILFMGDPVAIVDAGRWSGSDNNLGRFLRTYVESGEISVICEASPESLTAAHLKEPSFIDAFHRIEVAEPSAAEGLEILRAASERLADRLSVEVDESAVGAAVELTRRYEPYRSLPGKAVHLLDETARLGAAAGRERLEREDVVAAFAARSGLPHVMLSDDAPLDLDAARRFFEERVLGQADAIESVLELLGVVKAALNAPEKPLGTFFFVGPTGVGKTELAKALAEFLFGDRDRLLRFDMGEYGLRDAIPRLIGSAWQDEDEGELTRRVREQPFCVVLFDEIEKAHPDVFDVLLGVLGEGRLTDSNGRTADFRNAIVIMTSNLGADRSRSGAIGFASATTDERERLRAHYREEAEDYFRPEFVNRIDRFVAFDALDRDVVRRIARREIGRLLLREGLVRRQLLVEVDDAAVDALAEAGFDAQYGARPLQRQIERAVIQPLARLIVTKRPAPGDVVRIRVVDGVLAVELAPPPPTPEERREARRERRATSDRATTARAARAVQQLAADAAAEATGPLAEGLRLEVSSLVAQTQAPTFWDAADEARAVMARVYTLERIIDRLERLQGRAAGLVELAGHAERTGDRSRVPEILAAVDEIADALELTRLELHGAAAGGSGDAVVVRVTPVGGASADWADELAAMYRAWAERTGREVVAPANGGAALVEIRGPATLELLAAESGVHRRRLADRRELDARVSINGADDAAVVRVYEEGRRTVVRDPRTNARSTALADVLREGRIDQFLLEALRAGLRR